MNDITQQGQLADIARDFYLGQLTITQLSEKYQLSRYLITKALNEARAAGIVRITKSRPSGLRKTIRGYNSLAHKTTWLRSDFVHRPQL